MILSSCYVAICGQWMAVLLTACCCEWTHRQWVLSGLSSPTSWLASRFQSGKTALGFEYVYPTAHSTEASRYCPVQITYMSLARVMMGMVGMTCANSRSQYVMHAVGIVAKLKVKNASIVWSRRSAGIPYAVSSDLQGNPIVVRQLQANQSFVEILHRASDVVLP